MGLGYLRNRGFTDGIIEDYALGWCPEGSWGEEGALAAAARKAGYKEKWLLTSGLCKQRDDGQLYDFYRGRVMFPIRDVTGRFIGFGGRTLKSDKKVPKYVNSPESPLYDKSRALYGIHMARNAIVREDRAILVEGYTDVMGHAPGRGRACGGEFRHRVDCGPGASSAEVQQAHGPCSLTVIRQGCGRPFAVWTSSWAKAWT